MFDSMSIGPWQILLIVGIVLLVFGPKQIPKLGKSLGEALRGFKSGIKGDENEASDASDQINASNSESTSETKKSEKTDA